MTFKRFPWAPCDADGPTRPRLGTLAQAQQIGWQSMASSNLAARRGAKANRRKAIVAQKRKAELIGDTPAARIARAAAAPLQYCVLSESQFETGMGTLLIARGDTIGQCVLASFLLDTFCLGVKDVMFRTVDADELEAYVEMVDSVTPLVPVDPSYARKLLRDLVQWSNALGFPPHKDFTAVERLFGNVDPQACETTFEFGQAGKPLYVPGPTESPMLVRRRMDQLSRHLGPGGFDYMIAAPQAAE